MLKLERDYISDQETTVSELLWWNENAHLVCKVWEMHDDISWAVRKHYLLKAKSFFHHANKPVTVLELGCGSGWVGQFIAGPELRIIGSDFSDSQISLARENARKKGLDKFCQYTVSNSNDWTDKLKEVDGILIHAFLHHLDGRELDALFHDLKTFAKSGTKIWIYEPAFYHSSINSKHRLSYATSTCLSITNMMVAILHQIYSKLHLIDKDIADSFSKLVLMAKDNHWYLSPKEVPFNINTFSRQLANIFCLTKSYWATISLIGWIYESNLLKNPVLRKLIKMTLLPFFALTDSLLTKETNYLRATIVSPTYAFHVWEGVINNE